MELKQNKNIAALFDIDGTIFRDSLLTAHFKKLVKYEIISYDKIKHLEPLKIAWKNREITYDEYMNELIKTYHTSITGLNINEVEFAAKKTIETESKKLYIYTKNRIEWHRQQGHKIIFISGSPDFLVNKIANELNADLWFGSTYLTKNDIFTGDILPMWDSISKLNTIERIKQSYNIDLANSYAYGDTNGDYLMLSKVGNPYAINPNQELLNKLKDNNIKANIIVERKDVIHEFSLN